ncbi:MAG: glycogen/starch/alpha-glucan phosphorylase [Pirellulaceae bacterium]|nr:glycogen/starch/alpha-glucan phosphorylase [Pirellulaceae bacterium]
MPSQTRTPESDVKGEKDSLLKSIQNHIISTVGNDFEPPRKDTYYKGLAYSVRERLLEKWFGAQRSHYDRKAKRVYYLSMEFLPGRFLKNYITSLQMKDECQKTLSNLRFDIEELSEEEWDPGLGNGGLGRLASCFMDSMACLKIPGYGYGIRYDYGIFYQTIVDGYQVEECDNWLRYGNPWEIKRAGFLSTVKFYGRSEQYTDNAGKTRYRWVDTDNVNAMACDTLVPGYGNDNVNNMRLWAAVSSKSLNLDFFNRGDYMGAMEAKAMTENISKILYPSDEAEQGKELRLKQQYFLVAATFQDIMRRFKKANKSFVNFPDRVAIQLNDTHPAISIAELMRILVDEENLDWEGAWNICVRTFAYTNHTVLPEALETWSASLMGKLLPRHLEIIFEINHRFLKLLKERYPENPELLEKMAIIEENTHKRIRMAHLAIVGSHSVNGVAALHTHILKTSLFKEFHEFYPGKFKNITNGITPRRWLLQANPHLADLISETIGSDWITDLFELKKLVPRAEDPVFRQAWRQVKLKNKQSLAKYILRKTGIEIDPDTLFDVQVKRMHEYKRQVLNLLHVVTLYNRIKQHPEKTVVPRTVMFGGKAAPGYVQAKLIIKLINSVASVVNNDPDMKDRLKVVFLPNYCVSQAEKVIPASDLSEQISTAGMEASGTGNMKFALNGALTVGTLDGANIEIKEEVGDENIFIFGLTHKELGDLKKKGYQPYEFYRNDPELKKVIDMIGGGYFSPDNPYLFDPIRRALLDDGDYYFVVADYRSYIEAQEEVGRVYLDQEEWTRRSILNTANMGKFSSDRAILEYAEKIWGTVPPSIADEKA